MATEKTTATLRSLDSASRRDFLKFCSTIGMMLGLGSHAGSKVAATILGTTRPPVLWLHFSECTGCSEAALRASNPIFFDQLIFDSISLEYHETLMADSGAAGHARLIAAAEQYRGAFICVVEGAIPTADNGVYGTINGRTMLSIAQEICPKAQAIIAIGTCASFGGLAAAAPNPTGAKGLRDALPDLTVPIINISGCPPNPYTFASLIAGFLLFGTIPARDANGRPSYAYGVPVHFMCPYQNTDRCLLDIGCKGPICNNNCTSVLFNDETSFPMKAGHPCIGCSEPGFWDAMTPFIYEAATATQPTVARPTRGCPRQDATQVFDYRGRRIDVLPADVPSGALRRHPNGIGVMRQGQTVTRHRIMK